MFDPGLTVIVDAVPDGQTPHTVSLCVYDELVDSCKPGDRISVTGIFRSVPVRVNPRQRTIKSLFKTYVDVLHVRRNENGRRMGVDPTTRVDVRAVGVGGDEHLAELEEQSEAQAAFMPDADAFDADLARKRKRADKEEQLVQLSRREDLYDLLSRSIAPSIWEMEDVKKGILLQLFGGSNKSISTGGGAGGPRYRGDINVLLVGDPGTAKSQMLQVTSICSPGEPTLTSLFSMFTSYRHEVSTRPAKALQPSVSQPTSPETQTRSSLF